MVHLEKGMVIKRKEERLIPRFLVWAAIWVLVSFAEAGYIEGALNRK